MLVLTVPIDPTADMVLQHLHDDGVPFLRVDPAEFPTLTCLTARTGLLGRGGWLAELDGVPLDDVRAVYYRRPGRFVFNPAVSPEMLPWCEGQARYGFWGVLESLPARWINEPTRVHRAEYKPYQLAEAAAAGLTVPATLITNDPAAVAPFATAHHGGIVTKTLYARMPRTPDGDPTGVVYTEPVPPERYTDPAIAATAHLFQQRLDTQADVRVTVVDGTIFATEMPATNPTNGSGAVDWRRRADSITYRPHRLPDDITAGVRRLMRRLGLVFAALDFVITDHGHVFIEVNPNGQWGWIENHTGQPIGRAIADTLAHHPAHNSNGATT